MMRRPMKTPIQLYVTPDLRRLIAKGAAKAGLSLSEYIRQAIKTKTNADKIR